MKTLLIALLLPLSVLPQEAPPITGFEGHVDIIGTEQSATQRPESEEGPEEKEKKKSDSQLGEKESSDK